MKKILITGGSGFIGRNAVESFSGKFAVEAPTHAELDLDDERAVDAYFRDRRFDAVIHSAIKPGHRNAKDPNNLFYPNTRKFFNLVRHSSRFGRMIFLSSGLVYDMRHYKPLMREEYFEEHIPADEGGFSKYVCGRYSAEADNIIELRPFGVYGKYEDYAIRFISNMICKAVCGLPLTIKRNRRFDYVYITDLLRVIEHFILNDGKYRNYNVASALPVELLDIAGRVRAVSGRDLPITVAQPGMDSEYSGDNSRLRAELPDFPAVTLDAGIKELYGWYLSHAGEINRECLLADK